MTSFRISCASVFYHLSLSRVTLSRVTLSVMGYPSARSGPATNKQTTRVAKMRVKCHVSLTLVTVCVIRDLPCVMRQGCCHCGQSCYFPTLLTPRCVPPHRCAHCHSHSSSLSSTHSDIHGSLSFTSTPTPHSLPHPHPTLSHTTLHRSPTAPVAP
jgi:hypothetical protein